MSTRRRQTESAAAAIVRPILVELGLELIEFALSGPGHALVLRFLVDRPGGGITVDELAAASQAIEKAIEVAEVIPGRHRLEVSSPGLDRPWKTLRDFERHLGERVAIKTLVSLADGRRHLRGRVVGIEGEMILFTPDEGDQVTIPFPKIASARPEVDWQALLRGGAKPGRPVSDHGELTRKNSK